MDVVGAFHSYMKNSMFILLMFTINTGFSIRIGLISNATYIASNTGQTFSNMSCSQCTCAGVMASAVGWNCITTNTTCQLIKNYSSTDVGLIIRPNAAFFFQQSPPISITTTHVITTVTTVQTTTTTTIVPTTSK
jgi:hypothetical protein